MSYIKLYNPYDLPSETLHAIATGREQTVARILGIIARNAEGGAIQHLQIVAPRGYGKSFLLRLVLSGLVDRVTEGLSVQVAALPEEQPNVDAPHRLLNEIERVLAGRPPAALMGSAFQSQDGAWEEAVAALDTAIAAVLPEQGGVVVATVENFDALLTDIFNKKQDQSRLRAWLARPGGRLMLLATSTRRADANYEQRLFHATGVIALEPWREEACLAFFEKLRGSRAAGPMTGETRAKAKAIAQYIGGSPRMATVLAEVLETNDSLQAAAVLDALVDELTPYYKHRLESLPRQARSVLDALLRGGEPATQSALAVRLGTTQARIARPFQELHARGEVIGQQAAGSAEILYRIGDRLMAHYYRKRHLEVGEGASSLEAIADFLATFFSATEKQVEAQRLRGLGRTADAAVLERLVSASPAMLDLYNDFSRPETAERIMALVAAHKAADAIALSREAVAQAEHSGDLAKQARATLLLGRSLREISEHQAAAETLRRAISLFEQIGDLRYQALTTCMLSVILIEMGAYPEAADVARRATSLAEQAGDLAAKALATRMLGMSLGGRGEHTLAAETLRRAVSLAEQIGDLGQQAEASRLLGQALGQIGQQADAVATLRRAISLAEQAGDVGQQTAATRLLGRALGQMGEYAAAVETLRRAISLAEQDSDLGQQTAATCLLGQTLGQMGGHAEAVETLRRAISLAKQVGDLAQQAGATRLLGCSLAVLGEHVAAVQALRRSITLAEQAGDVREQAVATSLLAISLVEISLVEMGEAPAAGETLRRAISLAEQAGDLDRQATGGLILCQLADVLGDDAITVDAWRSAAAAIVEIPSGATTYNTHVAVGLKSAALASLRTRQFVTVWHTMIAIKADADSEVADEIASTIAATAAESGRAEAYTLAAPFIDSLADDILSRVGEAATVAPDPIAFLKAALARLTHELADPSLLRDIAGLLAARLPDQTKAEQALLEAAALRRERPDDPTALQRVDPDVATAINRILGSPAPPPVARKRRATRSKLSRPKLP